MAAIPLLLLSVGAAVFSVFVVERLQSESLERSFQSAAMLSYEVRNRLHDDAERLLRALPDAPPPPGAEPPVRARLGELGFDFAAWRLPDGGTRAVEREAGAAGEGLPGPADWETLVDGIPPEPIAGGAYRVFDGPGRPARAVGVRPDSLVLEAIGFRAADEYSRYKQLGRFEHLLRTGFAAGLAATVVLTGIAAFLVARRTARRIGRPVAELARSADRLAAGDLSHRADVRADGEIGELVSAFNRMGARLERSRDDLLRMERIAAWRDVARRVAHEIRNPLTPIRLAVHRLEKRVPSDEETRGCLASIGEEIGNLERISATFSEFAKMPEPSPAPTDLAAVAKSVAELFREATPGVEVAYEGPASLPLVGDKDLLRRAVTNLVKNASEAVAAGGGRVLVRVEASGDLAVLEVRDDGPGVPAAIRPHLFRPGVSGRPGGSGLGLAMVQRIAGDHRGALQWKDGDPGTVFRMEIPLGSEAT